ncbi:MAG: flagellar motor switch protein FliG [Pseudomonadota bacterium]
MAEESGNFSGAERSAILLMTLGESAASEIMRHLGPREVQSIGSAMAALSNVNQAAVKQVIDEFIDKANSETPIGIGADDYIRNVLTDALGSDKAQSMIDRILTANNTGGLESLKWMDARAISELIRFEHPQVTSIILSYLDSDQAAEVLQLLPDEARPELLMRIASLDGVQPEAMKELNELLESQLQGGKQGQAAIFGGIKCAAEILNFVDSSIEADISEKIAEADQQLAEEIQELMFVFDNLAEVDDRGMQTILRDVSTDNLVLALKAADDAIKDKIFTNMSSRAADMLKDDLDAKGPVKLSEVEAAQKEILGVARRLAEEGQISLGGAGGEAMV